MIDVAGDVELTNERDLTQASPPRRRGPIGAVITTLLAAVVLWGMVSGIVNGSGQRDRLRELTTELRCPLCQTESIADSSSQSAVDITAQIRGQLDNGWTDAQIKQFYVDRYGPSILLDPPRSGATMWLWIVPLVVVTGGAMAIVSRLDRSPRRNRLMGGAAGLGVASVAALVVLGLVEREPRSNQPAVAADAAPARDLSAVSNEEMEAVVAENPTVIGMRLALAERYLASEELDKALLHTTIAVDLPGTDQEYQRTLRLHGWVTALNGGAASGVEFLRAALALSPDDRDALWYLARVEFSGLGDAEAASEVLAMIDTTGMSEQQLAQYEEFRSLIEGTIGAANAPMSTDTVP
jgi:cytochrome c-type biogenesis protein CcmH